VDHSSALERATEAHPLIMHTEERILEYEGRYRLVRKLARGGMATVYEAEQLGPEGFAKRVAHRLLVVHDEAEVALDIRGLKSSSRERDELIAHVDEGHGASHPTAQVEVEDPPVPLERLVDVADLERALD